MSVGYTIFVSENSSEIVEYDYTTFVLSGLFYNIYTFQFVLAINRTHTVRECGPHTHCADRTPHFLRSRCCVGVSAGAVIHTPLEFSAGASADHTPK